jgi:hypothetical protein
MLSPKPVIVREKLESEGGDEPHSKKRPDP